MRLRQLLAGLAVGVLAVPFGLTFVVSLLIKGAIAQGPLERSVQLSLELGKALSLSGPGLPALRPDWSPPAWAELALADAEGRILVSSSPDLPRGGLLDAEGLAAMARAASRGRSLVVESIRREGRAIYRYAALVSDGDLPAVRRGLGADDLAIIGGLAGLALLAAFLAAAYLARSISRLEAAALKISGGDLESPVRAGGVREIDSLARAMDRMRLGLKEDQARRSRFFAAVSHDLRTPMTSLRGYLEALEDGLALDPDLAARYLESCKDKARVLEGRVDELLEFTRLETGEWRLRFEELDLAAFLARLAPEYAEDARAAGRRLEARLEPESGYRVLADARLLSRALENLFSNALRYASEGGRVRLAFRALGARGEGGGAAGAAELEAGGEGGRAAPIPAELSIEDDGPGIPEAERALVFEPWYRGSAGRESSGLGLGLYIAASVLRGHGWTVEAGASELGGARLLVRIPGAAPRAEG